MLFRLRKVRPTLADRNAPRLPAHATRAIRCYRCGSSFETSAFAESTCCASCGGAVRVPNITVDRGHWGGSLQTAGCLHVTAGSTVRANLVVASGDILIDGTVHAMLIAGGTIRVTQHAQLRGGARCKTLIIEPGAIVQGGPFESHSDALGKVDIEMASRAVPGKGPAADVEALQIGQESQIEPKPVIIRMPTQIRSNRDEPRLRVVP
ncbi:MAG: polymer-forming cytoskeletal protein [Phycisphaerales bacterium]